VREDGELLLVKHQAFAKVADDRITDLSLVCYGFRPLETGSRDEGKVDGPASGVLRSEG
jgi:hypothetical protein